MKKIATKVFTVLFIGILFGVVGLFIGYQVPILLKPTSPQGPLIGIFVSGPLSLLLGILLGYMNQSIEFSLKKIFYVFCIWMIFVAIATTVRCLQ